MTVIVTADTLPHHFVAEVTYERGRVLDIDAIDEAWHHVKAMGYAHPFRTGWTGTPTGLKIWFSSWVVPR